MEDLAKDEGFWAMLASSEAEPLVFAIEPGADAVTITVQDFTFQPATVPPGATVRLLNGDSTDHTVESREHLWTFDPRLGDAAGLGFDLAMVRKFPVAGLPPPAAAGELAKLLGETLATQARRSLRERRFGDALRELSLLARHRFGVPPRPAGSDRARPG